MFQWTSDPVEPSKGREDTVHFSSFKLDNMTINTGDFVLVRNTPSPDFDEVCTLHFLLFVMISLSSPG